MKTKTILLTAVLLLSMSPLWGQLLLNEAAPTVSENFDSMYESGEPTLTLPAAWRVDRHLSLPRQINAWANCSTTVMYSGGVSLSATATNGTWNFGSSADATDRAVGGISTGGADKVDVTKGFSILTSVKNTAEKTIDYLTLSYDIEKYRKGANNAGFTVQLYTSTNGTDWTAAGSNFTTVFPKDDETAGAAIVPIETQTVTEKTLKTDIAQDDILYIAWNISISTGTAANAAMALALDNVEITAHFSADDTHYIYIENVTRQSNLQITTSTTEPTRKPDGTTTINGVEYSYFAIAATQLDYLYVMAGSYSYTLQDLDLTNDLYLCMSKTEITTITDPQTYTGWVDPDRKPFKSSGIYLRGEINSWGAVAEWEFSDEGEGLYVLYDKTISGSFKIADSNWSGSCNYGSNGAQIMMDMPYELVAGTNDNISVGGNTYTTQRILLTINSGTATLLLESAEAEGTPSSIYVIGDHNNWNYMDTSGELLLDLSVNCPCRYTGTITLHPAEGKTTSSWRIYQGLGMSGVWGASDTEGLLQKGSTEVIVTPAGTYDFNVDLINGTYTLTPHESVLTEVVLQPQEVYLVPEVPEKVRVLSLNNSLINYNNQASVFSQFAQAAGKDAVWTPHSILGQPLSTHFSETGTQQNEEHQMPAKDMVRSEAWSHIILQEQSSLPRTNPERFYQNVRQWVEFIREECPNPNAVIILPLNWAYSGDWTNFTDYNAQFLKNYMTIARELGLVVCPVGVAYQMVYDEEGSTGIASWFQDDRHPTNMSTYMAAVMEYAIIFGEDPTALTWHPASVTEQNAEKMRRYAFEAVQQTQNYVEHTAGKVHYDVVCKDQYGMVLPVPSDLQWTTDAADGTLSDAVFTSDGTQGEYTVTVTVGTFQSSATIHVVAAVPYTALPQTIAENPSANQKLLIDGILYLYHNGNYYNLQGMQCHPK